MLNRHKIPTVFSIYMLDVLCCALGCIVLLWQVSYHDAEEKSAAAAAALDQLATTRQGVAARDRMIAERDQVILKQNQAIVTLTGELESLRRDLQAAQDALAESTKKYVALVGELDKTRQARALALKERDDLAQLALIRKQEFEALKKNHRATEALLAKLTIELKELQGKNTLTAAQLADKLKAHADLLDKIAKAEARIVLLEKDLDVKKLEFLLAAKKLDEKTSKLQEAETRLATLQKELIDLRGSNEETLKRLALVEARAKLLEQDNDRGKLELADANRRLKLLMTEQEIFHRRLTIGAKDLAEARAQIASLEGERISLLNKTKNIQAAMENRFAGITLTGKKVIFVVDTSGSMELTDENTLDPDKWPLVCDTVGRLMQSLTDLRQFQVITFADKIAYPLKNERRWLEYDGPATAKAVVAALRAIKPRGGTNMYAPMAEAFLFRELGLDTIYLLSDGLPNLGEGLPPQANKLSDQEITDLLAKTVRRQLKVDWNRYLPGQPRVRINTIGFFYESPDVGAFLWALARENDGSFVGMSR
ncbi:MAG: VWA domain-containing protein [Gemmataceae bacterium]|nr:VWA domain-containing protein [Gemmataceae bacterium]